MQTMVGLLIRKNDLRWVWSDDLRMRNGKRNKHAGKIAGSYEQDSRYVFQYRRKKYYRSRMVWEFHFGTIPDGMQIDHIDRNVKNDRIENLRLATHSNNQWNRSLNKNNKSGFKGVHWHPGKGVWVAQIRANCIQRHLGYFATAQGASKAYNRAALELHGAFARVV